MIIAMEMAVPAMEITLTNRFSFSMYNACFKYCFTIKPIIFDQSSIFNLFLSL